MAVRLLATAIEKLTVIDRKDHNFCMAIEALCKDDDVDRLFAGSGLRDEVLAALRLIGTDDPIGYSTHFISEARHCRRRGRRNTRRNCSFHSDKSEPSSSPMKAETPVKREPLTVLQSDRKRIRGKSAPVAEFDPTTHGAVMRVGAEVSRFSKEQLETRGIQVVISNSGVCVSGVTARVFEELGKPTVGERMFFEPKLTSTQRASRFELEKVEQQVVTRELSSSTRVDEERSQETSWVARPVSLDELERELREQASRIDAASETTKAVRPNSR
jgi:hypothetical protein